MDQWGAGFVWTCFTLMVSGVAAVSSSEVVLTASSPQFYANFTKSLRLNCSLPHSDSSQFGGLISIIMSKREIGADFKEIAIISLLSGQGVHVLDDVSGGQVQGQIDLTVGSHIGYTWLLPGSEVAGDYQCAVNGFDKLGHPITVTATATLSEESVTLEMALQRIRELETSKDNLNSDLNTTQSLLKATQEMTAALDVCNHTQVNLTAELQQSEKKLNDSRCALIKSECELNSTRSLLQTAQDELTNSLDLCNQTHLNLTTELQQTKQNLSKARSELIKSNMLLHETTENLEEARENLTYAKLKADMLIREFIALNNLSGSTTTYFNAHYYTIHTDPEKMNISRLRSQCENVHGYLLQLNGDAEFDMIKQFIRNAYNGDFVNVVLGITDEGHEGTWRYFHDESRLSVYTNWHYNQPGGSTVNNCAVLYTGDMQMYDIICTAGYLVRYICEIPCGNLLPCS